MIKEWINKRILFLGDSITKTGLYADYFETYLRQYYFSGFEGEVIRLGLNSETVSGLSETEHPFPRPCLHERLERTLERIKPDIVFLCYGMNDGIYAEFDETRFAAFRKGMQKAIKRICETGAQVIVMTPPPFDVNSFNTRLSDDPVPPEGYLHPYKNYNDTIERYAEWIMTLDEKDGVFCAIDLFHPIMDFLKTTYERNPSYSSGDGIHPNPIGHWIIAKTMIRTLFAICLERMPYYVQNSRSGDFFNLLWFENETISNAYLEEIGHTNPNKELHALSVEQAYEKNNRDRINVMAQENARIITESNWQGYRRLDFYLNGREGILILPKEAREDGMWIWRAEFFGAFDWADREMLRRGYALAYYRISNMYGSPKAVALMEEFRGFVMARFKLSDKPILFGFSRGGLYSVNYAAQYPQYVTALYLDAPVLDITSWPAGFGKGDSSPYCWQECLRCYSMTEEEAKSSDKNPIDKVPQLFKAAIPIALVVGGADTLVPFCENGERLAQIYRGSDLFLEIVKPDCGHHPHSLEDPTPIVDFLESCIEKK